MTDALLPSDWQARLFIVLFFLTCFLIIISPSRTAHQIQVKHKHRAAKMGKGPIRYAAKVDLKKEAAKEPYLHVSLSVKPHTTRPKH